MLMIRWSCISRAPVGPISWDRGGRPPDPYLRARLGRAVQTLPLRRSQLRPSQELGDAQQGVTADGESGQEGDLLLTDHLHLAHRPAVLAPAEALFDAFAQPLAGQITRVTRRARIDRRTALLSD